MDTNLINATESLYNTFKRYPILGNLRSRSCNCCVTDEEIRLLLSKPLKELNDDDIGHFFRSAISTFGDVEDFKHFLPRILELMQNPNSGILYDFTTFEKLNYSEWETWDRNEIESIENYFKELLIYALNNDLDTIDDYIDLNFNYINFNSLIEILSNTNSKKFIASIIDTTLNSYYYKTDDRLFNFFSSQLILDKIEKEFFETKDEEYATRVSITHKILESRNYEN